MLKFFFQRDIQLAEDLREHNQATNNEMFIYT
jgi:hypothetical protein